MLGGALIFLAILALCLPALAEYNSTSYPEGECIKGFKAGVEIDCSENCPSLDGFEITIDGEKKGVTENDGTLSVRAENRDHVLRAFKAEGGYEYSGETIAKVECLQPTGGTSFIPIRVARSEGPGPGDSQSGAPLESKTWWESDDGQAAFGDRLMVAYGGKSIEILKSGPYLIFLIMKGIRTENVDWIRLDGSLFSQDIEIPEYVTCVFDTSRGDFQDGEDAKQVIYKAYLKNYLKEAAEWGYPYGDHISWTAKNLKTSTENPWISIGGPVAAHMTAAGKSLAVLLVTKDPASSAETFMDTEASIFLEIGSLATERAEKEGVENSERWSEVVDAIDKIHTSKPVLEEAILTMDGLKAIKAKELFLKGKGLTLQARKDLTSLIVGDVIGEQLLPTEAVTTTLVYFAFSGEAATAAEDLGNEASVYWSRFKASPDEETYADLFYTLMLAYQQLALGYEYQAKALEANLEGPRGDVIGFLGELVHDASSILRIAGWNYNAPKDSISTLRDQEHSIEQWEGLCYISAIRPIYWSSSAAAGLKAPDLSLQSSGEASIASCKIALEGARVKGDAEISSRKAETHTFAVGMSLRSPENEIFDTAPVQVTIQPGGSVHVEIYWEIPEGVTPGLYDATVALWEPDFSGYYDRWGWREDLFEVPEMPPVLLSQGFEAKSYDYGDEVKAFVEMRNDGPPQDVAVLLQILDSSGEIWREGATLLSMEHGKTIRIPFSWMVDDATQDGEFTSRAKISWGEGKQSLIDGSERFRIMKTNLPPSIKTKTPAGRSLSVPVGEEKAFAVEIADPDGNLDHVGWYLNGTLLESHPVSGNLANDKLVRSFEAPGGRVLEARAFDKKGFFDVAVWDWIEVSASVAPPASGFDPRTIELISRTKVSQSLNEFMELIDLYNSMMALFIGLLDGEFPSISDFQYTIKDARFLHDIEEAKAFMAGVGISQNYQEDAIELISDLSLNTSGFCIVIVEYSYVEGEISKRDIEPLVCNELGDPYYNSWQFYESYSAELSALLKEMSSSP